MKSELKGDKTSVLRPYLFDVHFFDALPRLRSLGVLLFNLSRDFFPRRAGERCTGHRNQPLRVTLNSVCLRVLAPCCGKPEFFCRTATTATLALCHSLIGNFVGNFAPHFVAYATS